MRSASRPAADEHSPSLDARLHPRFKLETGICVYPRNGAVVRGDTVDISESGVSVVLRDEVPLGEVVRLAFSAPAGEIEMLALVRQRNAFRYGFQFIDGGGDSVLVRRTCRELSVKECLREKT